MDFEKIENIENILNSFECNSYYLKISNKDKTIVLQKDKEDKDNKVGF